MTLFPVRFLLWLFACPNKDQLCFARLQISAKFRFQRFWDIYKKKRGWCHLFHLAVRHKSVPNQPKVKPQTQCSVNKGNAKRGISPRLKFGLWPWKSIWFQILSRTKYVPSLVKIHWRMLILECSQGCYRVKIRPCDLDLWPMTLKINRFSDSLKD